MWIAGGWDWTPNYYSVVNWTYTFISSFYTSVLKLTRKYLKIGNHAGKLDHRLWGPPEKWEARVTVSKKVRASLLTRKGCCVRWAQGWWSPGPWVPALPGHESHGSWPRVQEVGPGLCACTVALLARQQQLSRDQVEHWSQKSVASPWGQEVPCPEQLQGTRLLCPWAFPGKNTGVGLHFLLQRIVLTQELNLGLLCLLRWWQADSLPRAPRGKPKLEAQPTPLPQSIGVNRFNSHREANRYSQVRRGINH